MTEQEIRDAAPSGATHYKNKTGQYYKWDGFCLFVMINHWWVFNGNKFNVDLKPL